MLRPPQDTKVHRLQGESLRLREVRRATPKKVRAALRADRLEGMVLLRRLSKMGTNIMAVPSKSAADDEDTRFKAEQLKSHHQKETKAENRALTQSPARYIGKTPGKDQQKYASRQKKSYSHQIKRLHRI